MYLCTSIMAQTKYLLPQLLPMPLSNTYKLFKKRGKLKTETSEDFNVIIMKLTRKFIGK